MRVSDSHGAILFHLGPSGICIAVYEYLSAQSRSYGTKPRCFQKNAGQSASTNTPGYLVSKILFVSHLATLYYPSRYHPPFRWRYTTTTVPSSDDKSAAETTRTPVDGLHALVVRENSTATPGRNRRKWALYVRNWLFGATCLDLIVLFLVPVDVCLTDGMGWTGPGGWRPSLGLGGME
jgi:hypothetical protein